MLPEEFGLNCEPLHEFRVNMDAILKALINSLVERDLTTGEVSAKVKVTVKPRPEPDGTVLHMLTIEPDLKMKIGAKGAVKCDPQSNIFMKYDRDEKIIIGEKQMDIDEFIRNR